ncbi:L2 protein VII precursor [Human mastadenovirus B]|nr:L2 protein VII precursor [Human mastadenovirus B]
MEAPAYALPSTLCAFAVIPRSMGALKGRTRTRTTVDDVIDQVVADARNYTPTAPTSTVDAVIDSVVADARAYARRKSRRRRIARRHRATTAMRAAKAILRRAKRVVAKSHA